MLVTTGMHWSKSPSKPTHSQGKSLRTTFELSTELAVQHGISSCMHARADRQRLGHGHDRDEKLLVHRDLIRTEMSALKETLTADSLTFHCDELQKQISLLPSHALACLMDDRPRLLTAGT